MGIIFGKNLAKAFFKSDDAGRRAFYPYGRFGKGYIVEPAQELEIEAYIGRQFSWITGLLFLQVAAQTVFGVGTALAVLGVPYLLFVIAFHLGLKRRTGGLPVSTVRMTGADLVRNQAQYMSATRAYGLLVVGVLMTLGSGFTAWHERGPPSWVGAFGVVFFGYGLVQFARIVKARWTNAER
jgi:hypothetical protein